MGETACGVDKGGGKIFGKKRHTYIERSPISMLIKKLKKLANAESGNERQKVTLRIPGRRKAYGAR